MADENQNQENLNRFANFAKRNEKFITTSEEAYKDSRFSLKRGDKYRPVSKEEAERILFDGDAEKLRDLSLSYYYASGFYKRLNIYYSTLLYYTPLIIPHMIGGKKKITDKRCSSKYYDALEFVNDLNFEQLCRHFALKVLKEGAYYGIIKDVDGECSVQDLPYKYCRSRLKTLTGVDIIEFDVTWFDTITDLNIRLETLNNFPKIVKKHYMSYKGGKKNISKWVRIPDELGVHFSLDEDKPFFACIIPSIINFNNYIVLEKEKDEQELKAIIAQELPHTANGDLILEPEEALEIHKGLAELSKKNKNLDAITTYGQIKVSRIHDDDSAVKNNLEKIESTIYSESGVSKQLFAAEGNISLEKSIQNDISFIMTLANSFSIWLKNIVNARFSDKYIKFGIEILPVGQYNAKDYLSQTLQSAQYGYSFILPSLAMGLEQNQILDLKSLEIDLLHMEEELVPLRSSHTESGNTTSKTKTDEEIKEEEKKAASKAEEDLTEKTIQNKESSGGEK